MHRLALIGSGFGPGQTWETGEIRVLTMLARAWGETPLIIFDVGANAGQWATEAIKVFQLAEMHCFEPSPRALAELTVAVSHPALQLHPFAFGDREGEALLFSDEPGSQLSSLYQRQLEHVGHHFEVETTVPVRRIDSFCAEAGISHIDLLKLDVEGGELSALNGAGGMLRDGSVEAIQFEFGTTTEAKVFFKDLFFLLNPHYRLYRIVRGGLVPIREYLERHEIFLPTNYLCISRRSATLAKVAG